ncbi:YbgA family protein [Desulfobaculum bizertense]|uniref:Uncharacterized conserved protein YbgA, DUF1722 family n=1 Tax=Desulfobaculum bizertense DSM 18034 TaxID=1121442 RepID=A0A1T4WCB2_9BACT|nr:DUF523 and DUF1722 domain-containing protein [Desulfobaculum bizertense]SKA74678.1 Uncharacterized conserved protein YbgA, DUF1722 family [Desulfobaculum bizertense DSM 18034]
MQQACANNAGLYDDTQTETIRLGIAKCLLGEPVRYDGGHKLDRYLRDVLGKFVEFVPVCPEVECGMPIPREAVRLVGDPQKPHLVGRDSGEDWTEQMQNWGKERLREMEKEGLCGYIFKSRSPSSGMERIKVFQANGQPLYTGVGMWADMVMKHFPLLPFEDDGRLHDMGLRENFIKRIFILKRWRDMLANGKTLGNLVKFHSQHKLLILSHNQEIYREMGQLVAQGKEMDPEELFCTYLQQLTAALSKRASVKNHVNVLFHMMGHFKDELSAEEKQELKELIEQYSSGMLPWVAPLTLINHYVRKYKNDYLMEQFYLHPHPLELRLLFHA